MIRAIVSQDQVPVALGVEITESEALHSLAPSNCPNTFLLSCHNCQKMRVPAANGSLRYIGRNFAIALKIWDPLGNEWITPSN